MFHTRHLILSYDVIYTYCDMYNKWDCYFVSLLRHCDSHRSFASFRTGVLFQCFNKPAESRSIHEILTIMTTNTVRIYMYILQNKTVHAYCFFHEELFYLTDGYWCTLRNKLLFKCKRTLLTYDWDFSEIGNIHCAVYIKVYLSHIFSCKNSFKAKLLFKKENKFVNQFSSFFFIDIWSAV